MLSCHKPGIPESGLNRKILNCLQRIVLFCPDGIWQMIRGNPNGSYPTAPIFRDILSIQASVDVISQ